MKLQPQEKQKRKLARSLIGKARAERMKEDRLSGLTLDQIGVAEGITRERVRQILWKFFASSFTGYVVPRRIKKEPVTLRCPGCDKEFIRQPLSRARYCTRLCATLQHRISPFPLASPEGRAWRKEHQRQNSRKYYHDIFKKRPGWQALIRERNRRDAQKRKSAHQ